MLERSSPWKCRAEFLKRLVGAAEAVANAEKELTEIDSRFGDADDEDQRWRSHRLCSCRDMDPREHRHCPDR